MRRLPWRQLRRPEHEWALLFAHIPKTAGSSLRDALGQLYLPDERLYLYDEETLEGAVHPAEFGGVPEEERAHLRFIAGHFYFDLYQQVPQESRYITAVRDPIDRVASLYFHYRRVAGITAETRDGSEGRLILEEGLSLDEWGFGLERIEIDNDMVRHVSARRGVEFGTCTDDMLDDALEHVEQLAACVLIVERMRESVRMLESVLGVRLPRMRRQNVNEQRSPIGALDPDMVARVRELNRLDEVFYHEMNERLDALGAGRRRWSLRSW